MQRGVIVAVVLVACWKPFGPPRPAQRAFEPQIRMVQLDNGLRVVALPDATATEIQLTMQVGVGSIDDPPGREGLAHLVEHLMFQQVVEGESLFSKLERHATSFNGFTELEATTFTERTSPANLDRFLAVEAARLALRCKTIDAEAIAREREVVRNELRQKSELLATTAAIRAGLFQVGHPYHDRLDSPESVAAITREQACAFADAHYAPDNAVLVVSGNVTVGQLEQAARRAFEGIPRRPHPARPALPAIARQTLARAVPIDATAFVYGWPLPADHVQRVRVRALASILADHVGDEIRGTVRVHEYGGDRAPAIVLAVVPAFDQPLAGVRAALEREIDDLPTSFDNQKFYDDSFDHAQRSELARLYATLEDGGGRDTYVAAHVLAGRDPSRAVADELHALASLERGAASKLARTALRRDAASIVTLQPEDARRTGRPVELDANLHSEGMRRVLDDPADAKRPARGLAALAPLSITTRKLASGIRVVLLPAASSPTVDVRVVFAAGTGDEPSYARGVALLAAYALAPELVDISDFVKFYEAGGTIDRRVGLDHTTFAARGLARDFDLLLVALERLLRNGHYQSASKVIDRMRAIAFARDPDAAVDAAWRAALHGPDHPYTAAGVVRSASFHTLDDKAAMAFRTLHYRPDAMTIIIAGGFDPKLADAWIDHQFATWSTARPPPQRYPTDARLRPTAIAVYDDTTMVQVQIALPVAGGEEYQLLAAELIDQTIADVRHQLGAAYSLSASVDSSRLASSIRIAGYVDASRATEAIALVRDRLAALRTPDQDTASRFVAARRRVAARLQSVETSSAALAALAERDTAADREVAFDFELAERVLMLTLPDLAPTLQSIELSRAALLLRGPQDLVEGAYKAIGRTPRTIDSTR